MLLVKSNSPEPAVFVMSACKVKAPLESNDNGPLVRTKQPPVEFPFTQPLALSESLKTVQPANARPEALPISLTSKAAKPFTPTQSPVKPVVLDMVSDRVPPPRDAQVKGGSLKCQRIGPGSWRRGKRHCRNCENHQGSLEFHCALPLFCC
jgi:hypothetical protein